MGDMVVRHEAVLPNPVTGELVDRESPVAVAGEIEAVDRLIEALEDYRHTQLEPVFIDASQRAGKGTLHLPDAGVVVTVRGGSSTEYDLPTLADLLRAAGLPEDRLRSLIRARTEYRLDRNVARQLRGANAEYAAALDQCMRKVPAKWSVKVERKGRAS